MTAPTVTRAVRAALDGACTYCANECNPVPDHVYPGSRGGGSGPENIVAACWDCNAEKADRTPDEWAADRVRVGLAWPVPSHSDFATAVLAAASSAEIDALTDPLVHGGREVSRIAGAGYLAFRTNPAFDVRGFVDQLLTHLRLADAVDQRREAS